MKRIRTLVCGIAIVALVALAPPGVQASHGGQKCGEHLQGNNSVYCPPAVRGASCHSYGVLITATDLTGGVSVLDFSESRTWATGQNTVQPPKFPNPGPPVMPGPIPAPPTNAQSHADANQVGVNYNNPGLLGGIGLDARTVFSRCDSNAWFTQAGLFTESYGRGGIEDLELSLPGPGIALHAEALDFEIHAYGMPPMTFAFDACDIAQLGATPIPGLTLSVCPAPNTAVAVPPVVVELNEQWGPVFNFLSGQWVYGGAAVHITVTTLVATVDIYLGYVTVGVSGGPAMPPTWVVDPLVGPGPVPCLPAPCMP